MCVRSSFRCSLLVAVTGVLLSTATYSQSTWRKTYGGFGVDAGHSVKQTSDGGYAVLGSTGSFGLGTSDFYLLKLDADGNLEWSQTYGTSGIEQGWSISLELNSFVLAGFTSEGNGGYDGLVVVTDDLGSEMWRHTYGTPRWDFLYDVASVSDGHFLVGQTFSAIGDGDAWLLRIDLNGDTLWTSVFGTAYEDEARGVQPTSDGGCIVAGTIGTSNGTTDAILAKFSDQGNEEWRTILGGSGNEFGQSVSLTSDGAYVLGGTTASYSQFKEMYLAKVDANGTELWTQHIGQIADWEGQQVRERQDGGLVLVGSTSAFGGGGKDVYLLFTDSSGVFEYGRTYGTLQDEEGWSVDLTLDGGFVVAGDNFSVGPGIEAVYVIKGDEEGMTLDLHDYPYFDPLATLEISNGDQAMVWPTLISTGEVMKIRRSTPGAFSTARITDMRGTILAVIPISSGAEAAFRVPDLAPGPYLITVLQNGEIPITAKFLIVN